MRHGQVIDGTCLSYFPVCIVSLFLFYSFALETGLQKPDGIKALEILTLTFFLCLSFNVTVARHGHSSVVLSDGSVLVMGGNAGVSGTRTNDVWRTVDDGANWILVTSSAGWTGKKILHRRNSLCLLPSLVEDARTASIPCVSCLFCRCDESILFMIFLLLTSVTTENECFFLFDGAH